MPRYAAFAAGAWLLASLISAASAQATAGSSEPAGAAEKPAAMFAIVGATIVTVDQFDAAFAAAQRSRFYHAKVPDAQLNQLRREVGDELINGVLLADEVQRRNVEPDRDRVNAELAQYEKRYGGSPQWARMKAEALPALTAELERRSKLARIEGEVRAVAPPDESTLREFYRERLPSFTEPEQVKVSVILLKVDPGAPASSWERAREEAAAIRARIERGASFAELARLHSADASAANGGDMGYLHRGMLPDAVQEQLDKLASGEVGSAVTTLEGVVLLRADDRRPARVRDFETVRERAQQLWQREEGERAWRSFLARLRAQARIQIVDASRYPAAAAQEEKPSFASRPAAKAAQ